MEVADGLFLVCALTCDDICGVEFEDEVGLDGLGVRARPSAGCGLVLAALVVSGFQGWRASYCIVANRHGRVKSLESSLQSYYLSSQCSFQGAGVWLPDGRDLGSVL